LIILFGTCKKEHFQAAFHFDTTVNKGVPKYGTVVKMVVEKALACRHGFWQPPYN
jgi:hypothetical protein